MATYKGKAAVVNQPAVDVYNKISNLESYRQRLETLPPELREKLGDVQFTGDSIIITAQPVGNIVFQITEKVEPKHVRLEAQQSPVPFAIIINLADNGNDTSTVTPELNVEIPPMLKPLVGGKLQEAADKFGDLISTLFA